MTPTKDQQAQEYAEKKTAAAFDYVSPNIDTAENLKIPVFTGEQIKQAYLDGYTACEQSMWRSVEEELPPGTLVVLCQSRMDEDNAIALCVYIKNRFMIYDRTFKYDKEFYPTHWMPIPPIPDTNTEKI